MKKEVLDSSENCVDIDLKNEENLLPSKSITLSFAVKEALRTTHGLTKEDHARFREKCRLCLIALCCKLSERSPLKFRLTEAVSFLDPEMVTRPKTREKRLRQLLKSLLKTA